MTLVMVHAQDHLMTSILAKELIAELIAIYRAQPLHALARSPARRAGRV